MRNKTLRSGSRLLLPALVAAALLLPAAWAQSRGPGDPSVAGAGVSRDPSVNGPAGPNFTHTLPMTREERIHWFLKSTVGPKSLGAGVISSAWSTAFNNPEEYGPHWEGSPSATACA